MTLNAIIANFQTFKLVDLLDIIIISFLIYQLLGIVNRTRAGQLFKGALLVMAVYLVAETLNMRTVTWLLNSLLQVGLLTLVVLFQPENPPCAGAHGPDRPVGCQAVQCQRPLQRPQPKGRMAQCHHCHLRRRRALFGDQDRCADRAGTPHEPF
ncbi:hypothetical protein ACKXF7_10045 [Faecalibacterium sp. 7]|uniref:hypothetical protein n=1 Tax=Faecalibacterium sp. 7 TaxID=3402017 RepID=UPI003C30A91D